MLGLEVTKPILDFKFAEAVIHLRAAFDQIETIAKWLADHPNPGSDLTTDPLIVDFEYTVEEAYAVRIYFETLESVRNANSQTFDVGRKMSGLS